MNLHETLNKIAADFEIDGLLYAEDDPHNGWDNGDGDWPVGSIFGVEGKILYSLIRFARPAKVLEIGTAAGCSATHILQALTDNKKGNLLCIDKGTMAGENIPAPLRKRMKLQIKDAYQTLAEQPSVDFVFEDGAHDAISVEKVVRMAVEKLTPGGWLISHDAGHFIVGPEVLMGWRNAGIEPKVYLTDPSDCGLAIWRKPLDVPAPVKPTPKKKTTRKKRTTSKPVETPAMPQGRNRRELFED